MAWFDFLREDPIVRATLVSIDRRLGVIEAYLARPATPTKRLDCGHEDTGWATSSDGLTTCLGCHQKQFQE